MRRHGIGGAVAEQQFGYHFAAHYQIGQRHIFHLQHIGIYLSQQFAAAHAIAHHLRSAEHGCLERGCSRCHQCHPGVCHKFERLPCYHLGLALGSCCREHLVVEARFDARCACYHKLIVVEVALGCLKHYGQIVENLFHAAAGHKGYDGLSVKPIFPFKHLGIGKLPASLGYLVHRRIAHILHLIAMASKKFGFKGQYRIECGDIFLYLAHAILFPRPHFG